MTSPKDSVWFTQKSNKKAIITTAIKKKHSASAANWNNVITNYCTVESMWKQSILMGEMLTTFIYNIYIYRERERERNSCGFTCQQRVLKMFPVPGYLHSDWVVWLWYVSVNLHIYLIKDVNTDVQHLITRDITAHINSCIISALTKG